MEGEELVVRIAAYLPLLVITAQVFALSRILTSRAWTLLNFGFGTFAFASGLQFFVELPVGVRLATAALGYFCIAFGLHVFRLDLHRVLLPRPKKGAEKVMTPGATQGGNP